MRKIHSARFDDKNLNLHGCKYNVGDTMVYQTLRDLHAMIWFEKQSRDYIVEL